MKVETIAGSRLRVWLSNEESEKWGILRQEEPDSRRRAVCLVRRALHMAKRQWDTALLAEVFPVADGCVLLLSPHGEVTPQETLPVVYRVADADALCDLAGQWCRLPLETGGRPVTALYERAEGYDLAVCPVQPLSEQRQRVLEEYGHPIGMGQAAVAAAAEYGRFLAGGDALGRFTAPAPRSPRLEDRRH